MSGIGVDNVYIDVSTMFSQYSEKVPMQAFSFYHLIARKVKNKGLLHVICNIDDILVQHQTRPRHLAVSQLVTWELTPPGTQGWAGRSMYKFAFFAFA